MKRSSNRLFVVLACMALAFASATALAACGDSDEDAQSLTFELSGKGQEMRITGPESADPGEAEITLVNEADSDGEVQLIRTEGDHTAAETIKAFGGAQAGKPLPDWVFAGGGVGIVGPGEEKTVTQVMEPGTYYAFNTAESAPAPDPATTLAVEVSGEPSDAELSADATVTASEYAFAAEGLEAGENQIDFRNAGAQPHHLILAPLKGDATVADVKQALKDEKGPPPFDDSAIQDTAVIEGGEGQLVDLDLEPGRYVMLCFISDRQGGPPHAFKGMVDEVEVE